MKESMRTTKLIIAITLLLTYFVKASNTGSLTFDGLKRSYIVYLPKHYNKANKSPIIFVLHGGGSNAKEMSSFSNFNSLADIDTCIIVYPNAYKDNWNDGRYEIGKHPVHEKLVVNDVGFIDALITLFQKDYNADSNRVYATGIANGAIMAYRLGCELSHRLTAIAPVLGNVPDGLYNNCRPIRPISVMAINGSEDRFIPFQGGDVRYEEITLGKVKSANESIRLYASANKCNPSPIRILKPDRDRTDGTTLLREVYNNGEDDTEAVLCIIKGGGHAWPGARQSMPPSITGNVSREIDATTLIWNFFKSHVRE